MPNTAICGIFSIMPSPGDIPRTPEQTFYDFGLDDSPSLFIDNWGIDVVATQADKLKQPIASAVKLAQLVTAIQTGQAIQPDRLDIEHINSVTFVDGSDGNSDHYFFFRLQRMFVGGSYMSPRVGLALLAGYSRLDGSYSTYDGIWDTLHESGIARRSRYSFKNDLDRFNNALSQLQGMAVNELITSRPGEWPGEPDDPARHQAELSRISAEYTDGKRQPIFVGKVPLVLIPESRSPVYIPRLDGPEAQPVMEDAEATIIDAMSGRKVSE